MDIQEARKYIRMMLRKKEMPDAAKALGYVYATEAIETILSELDKKDKIIAEMARLFSKISKGEYVTIEKNIEVDKVIEYFTKKVKEN